MGQTTASHVPSAVVVRRRLEAMTEAADLHQILLDPAWAVAGVVIGAVALIATVIFYLRGRSRKQLSFWRNVTQLVSIHNEARGRVTLNFEGEPVSNAYLIEVHLANSGNVAITDRDFVQPVEIILGGEARVMTAEEDGASPDDLDPKIEIDQDRARLVPLLLNPGDELTIKVLVRDFTGKVRVHARIVGIKELTKGAVSASPSLARLVRSNPILFSLVVSVVAAGVIWLTGIAYSTVAGPRDTGSPSVIERRRSRLSSVPYRIYFKKNRRPPICAYIFGPSDGREVRPTLRFGYLEVLTVGHAVEMVIPSAAIARIVRLGC